MEYTNHNTYADLADAAVGRLGSTTLESRIAIVFFYLAMAFLRLFELWFKAWCQKHNVKIEM